MTISTEPFSKSPLDGFDLINLIAVLWQPHRRSVFKQWSDIDVKGAHFWITRHKTFTNQISSRVCFSNYAIYVSVKRYNNKEVTKLWKSSGSGWSGSRDFLKEFLPLWNSRYLAYFVDNSKSCRQILMKFVEGWDGCLTSNKPFDVCADLDHDPDPGIFNGIFIISTK